MHLFKTLQQYFRNRRQRLEENALEELKARYHAFRIFLENNGRALELTAEIDGLLFRAEQPDIRKATEELLAVTGELVEGLNLLSGSAHAGLYGFHGRMAQEVLARLDDLRDTLSPSNYIIDLNELDENASLQAGAKAANLARMRHLALPVPNGFVCTTPANKKFLGTGELAATIRQLLRQVEYEKWDVSIAAEKIREMIMQSPLPAEIGAALAAGYQRLEDSARESGTLTGPLAISVRSSGVSEDGRDHSFAGQFTSILNVIGTEALFAAYREVIASGFSARAISYRLNAGLFAGDFDLAVLCQVMVEPHCAGVMFTFDPSQPENGRMLISAAAGLGSMAVGGAAPVDLYTPPRGGVTATTSNLKTSGSVDGQRAALLMEGAQIPRKTMREVSEPQGGVRLEQIPDEEALLPLLSVEALNDLVHYGKMIEGVDGGPQDVEWALLKNGKLVFLQARPLRLTAGKGRRLFLTGIVEPLTTGICASTGKAVGQVRLVHSITDLQRFDQGQAEDIRNSPAILVLPHGIVDAARYLQNSAGAIIQVGNPTDHLSCIAREYGIPMITGAENAGLCLHEGQWIVLDAEQGIVLDAPESIWESAREAHAERHRKKRLAGEERSEQPDLTSDTIAPERRLLREMIVPLNLTDTYGPTFSLQECRSIHDIIRYTHEKAVLAMFSAGDMVMEEAGNLLRPLSIGIPFFFLVIDVGGGVRRESRSGWRNHLALHRPLGLEDILSVPLTAFCEGLLTPGLSWHTAPDDEALPEIFSRTMFDKRGARPAGSFNYALAARDYLNLNARVEFHFAMLDSVCGRDTYANYIRFRFKGGGAGLERGHRRAIFLRQVLENNGFYTTVVGDLITASLTGASKETVYDRLIMLGRLIGYSRYLDGVMTDDQTPFDLAKAFLAGRYDRKPAGVCLYDV
ncbi:MAG: PEP/pyruvate-binding domain-containing protein [Pseudomonadota bacterium]